MKIVYSLASALLAYCFLVSISASLLPVSHSYKVNSNLTFQIVSYDCNSGVLQYKVTGGNGSPVNLTLPGIFAGTVSAESVTTHTFPGDARVGRTITGTASQDGNQISISFTTGCNLTNSGSTPPSNPNPGNNSPSGGNLAFQIVSYDCNSGILQYKLTGGNGAPINLTLPGIFAGNVSAESIATHTFPGDARMGRTVNGTASQNGNQISINFTTGCNLSNSSPNSNPPSNPNPGTNPSSGGNLSFQIVSYDCNSGVLQYKMIGGSGSPINLILPGIFAGTVSPGVVSTHTFPGDARVGRTMNGTASQDGNQISFNFTTSCNLSSSNPSTGQPTNQPSTSNPAGSNFNGSLDETNCHYIRGWVVNRNTTHQSTKVDIYVNGWLVVRNATANMARQDVANSLGISGYNSFGFEASIPRSFKLGSALTISVKFAGTSTNIPGSPRTTEICPDNRIGLDTDSDCNGQVARVFPGAEEAITTVIARTGATGLQLNAGKLKALTSKLISINKGFDFSLNAYAFAPAATKQNLNPHIAKAIAGGAVVGLALSRKSALPDQRSSIQTLPTVGVGTALMLPLVKAVLANRLPKAGIELAFYDKNGRFIYRQEATIDKSARNDWQLVHIQGRAVQDGYVRMRVHNRSKIPVYFDDIKLKIETKRLLAKSNETESYSQKSSSTDGFAAQVNIYKNRYLATADDDCEESTVDGSIITLQEWANISGGNWLDPVNVTAPAPSYGYSGGEVVPLPNTGGSGNEGGNSGGGNSGSTPPKAGMNPKEITCEVLKAAWENSGSFAADGNWWGSKENAALLTSSGILWLPTEGIDNCTGSQDFNNTHSSNLNYSGCLTKENGKVYINYEGQKLEVYATMHTHPNSLDDTVASPADINNQSNRGIPTYIIGYNNVIKLVNGTSTSIGSRNDITNCLINYDFYK